MAPAYQTAFVYGVQRVYKHLGAVNWKAGGAGALAKPAYQGIVGLASESCFTLSLAAAAGELAAAKDRDDVSTKMTLEQMARAKQLALDWMLAKAQEKAAKCKDLQLEDCN